MSVYKPIFFYPGGNGGGVGLEDGGTSSFLSASSDSTHMTHACGNIRETAICEGRAFTHGGVLQS